MVLEQYKEKKLRYKTICEKFNTSQFAVYKDKAIEFLQKITAVSE